MDFYCIDYMTYGNMLAVMESLIRFTKQFSPTHIYAPKRGGWPIGVHLSHQFDNAVLLGQNWGSELLNVEGDVRLLFADDIVDNGATLSSFVSGSNIVSSWLPNLRGILSCALVTKKHSPIQPDIYIQLVPDETWVIFPWEKRADAAADRAQYETKLTREESVRLKHEEDEGRNGTVNR